MKNQIRRKKPVVKVSIIRFQFSLLDFLLDWSKKDPSKLTISRPTNFNHPIHVTYNSSTGEFDGMPELWSSLLHHSRITKQEQKQNPQAVIDALDFYQHAAHKRESKFMYSSCKNLTPPISGDLADRFRQTIVLVSGQSTPVKTPAKKKEFFQFS
jgi:hypothetical protein